MKPTMRKIHYEMSPINRIKIILEIIDKNCNFLRDIRLKKY
jgi:hypothetical protein